MSDGRRTKLREAVHLPNMKLDVPEAKSMPDSPLSPEQNFLKRKAEVTQQDHEEFSEYLQEKSSRAQQQTTPPADAPPVAPSRVNRRSLLKWAAGSAAAPTRSTSIPAGRSPGSHTGTTAITTRSRTTCAPSRARTRPGASNGST